MDHVPVSPRHRLSSLTVHAGQPRQPLNFLRLPGSVTSPTCSRIGRKISDRCPTEMPPYVDESQLEFLGSIGTGAFGRALKVRHRELDCLLVLKEVLTECKEDEAALVHEVSPEVVQTFTD
ncbi:LIM domain kinase 1 [Fasciola hepatica]|uniref:LIM domain kinase 1 n=1 Tax=Fasciola hepatica TaxID=6192 RepID=A0A4E0RLS7_FASHE|nr:LIM domain kinase 1 [Fasciola hepatica]